MAIQSKPSNTVSLVFPKRFTLADLLTLYEPVFELKKSPLLEQVSKNGRGWFAGFGHFDDDKLDSYLKIGQFDLYVVLAFPNTDLKHLETCLYFLLWAFSADDITDEGELQARPQDVQADVDKSGVIIHNLDSPRPVYPYAAMLHDILKNIRSSASPEVYNRFCAGWEHWTKGQVKQSGNRSLSAFPSVEEFVAMRRATIGGRMVLAMVQYAFDLEIPDDVLAHPDLKEMGEAAIDLMAWPNDLVSFNKEQADGDLQNLVCILMVTRQLDLQAAVDALVDMISDRIDEYAKLKRGLPSFGPVIDAQVAVYLKNLEHYVQGTVKWYYSSPRYFPPAGIENVKALEIEVLGGYNLARK